jgi:soluble lytic murein transglycosylase-like protein
VQADSAKWRNSVLELSGAVAGVSRSDAGASLLVRVASGDVILVRASQDAELPASGDSVRVLASVEGATRFSLLGVVTEAEIGDTVLDPPKAAAKPAATKGATRRTTMPAHWPVATLNRSGLASRMGIDPRVLSLYQQVILQFNPRLSVAQAGIMARTIVDSSYGMGVDARLIMAIFATESRFKVNARSRCGAMGIGQLMPGTARSLGVSNAYDPEENILGAVRLIQKHWITYAAKGYDFSKVFSLVCAAYNAGPNAVRKYGGVPPYRETQQYVKRVAKWYSVFAPELFTK